MLKIILLFCCVFLIATYPRLVTGKLKLKFDGYDAVFVTRCEAACWKTNNKRNCVKNCLSSKYEKLGVCQNSESFTPFCLESCQNDSECPEIRKCCRNGCKKICQNPLELDQAIGVPEIPKELTVSEGRRKRTVYVEWKPGLSSYSGPLGSTLYLIEERHHSGRFNEFKLSKWTPCARTPKSSLILRNFVKAGKRYQFRVAAVNENGTKGFTELPSTYSVLISPKPPKAPHNVTVGPFSYVGGSLNAELQWAPPVSDFPIQKYKVFWSRRLYGGTALDSVLVNQQTVPRGSTKFLLQNLQVNSLYFIQVQALLQYGKERIKGEKSGLVLNTTNYTNLTDPKVVSIDDSSYNIKSRIENFHLEKLFWTQRDLRARMVWDPQQEPVRYTVSWWSGPCYHNLKKGYSHFKLAATTKASHYDLYNLQFNCRYRVSVRDVSQEGVRSLQDTSITFTTPSCSVFKNSTSNKKIKCPKSKQQKSQLNA